MKVIKFIAAVWGAIILFNFLVLVVAVIIK